MIKNKDIICFSLSDWRKEMVSNRHHILSRFARHNRVFLFERPIVSTDHHRLSNILRPIRKEGNLIIISPIASVFEELLRETYRFYLKKIYQSFNLLEPIWWFYDYSLSYLIDEFPYLVSCYHCTEDYSHLSQISSEGDFVDSIAQKEKDLVKKVDLVFAVSEYLVETHHQVNHESFLITNAVDYELYKQAQAKPVKKFGKTPIVGYCGNLSDKVNFELLYRLAKELREVKLILIGPVTTQNSFFKKLHTLKNVIFISQQPVAKLPSLIQEFDVCLMPYIQDDWFMKVSRPLKLFEYLATGKPIVSTRMDCLKNFKKNVYETSTTQDFIDNVRRVISEKDPQLKKARIDLAQKNTWDDRFLIITSKIEKFLQRKINV